MDECIYEDSMKIYLAQVLCGGKTAASPRGDRDLLAFNRVEAISHANGTSDFMATATSQSFLCDKNAVEPANKDLRETENIQGAVFELESIKCADKKVPHKIIAAVKEIFPIREIWIKKKKSWVTTAMIVVCDSRGCQTELVMWGRQCKQVLSLSIGCVVCLNEIYIGEFRGDTVIKMRKNSKISNLGHVDEILRRDGQSSDQLTVECRKFKECFPELCRKTAAVQKQHSVQFCNYEDLMPGKICHIKAKIVSFTAPSRGTIHDHHPTRITVSLHTGLRPCLLFLNGSAKSWRKRLILSRTKVWEFFYIACCSAGENDSVELHTTVLSQAKTLFDDEDSVVNLPERIKIACHDELMKHASQSSEMEVFELCNIKTSSLTFCVNGRMIILNHTSPADAVENIVNKCTRLCETVPVSLTITCCFEGDTSGKTFRVNITLHVWENLNLPDLLARPRNVLVSPTQDTKPDVPEDSLTFNWYCER